jgi:hypothetical protein
MRLAKYLLVPAILCMPIPANFETASISGVLAAKELPLTLLLVVVNGTAIDEAAAPPTATTTTAPQLEKRYDGFLSSGSALDLLLKAGFDLRFLGGPGSGNSGNGGYGGNGGNGGGGGNVAGGDRSSGRQDHDVKVCSSINSPPDARFLSCLRARANLPSHPVSSHGGILHALGLLYLNGALVHSRPAGQGQLAVLSVVRSRSLVEHPRGLQAKVLRSISTR